MSADVSANAAPSKPASVVIGHEDSGDMTLVFLNENGHEYHRKTYSERQAHAAIRHYEQHSAPRWIFRSIRDDYPTLLADGVRVARAWDLLLCHQIIRDSALIPKQLPDAAHWRRSQPVSDAHDTQAALFAWISPHARNTQDSDELYGEYSRQRDALASSRDGRVEMLCRLESAGALVAEEMTAAGVPWNTAVHEQILEDALGPRGVGGIPQRMRDTAAQIRTLLNDPQLSIDSQPKLLRALQRAGVAARSTSKHELVQHQHPAIVPLLEYKRMARLFAANGWTWLAEWVHDERFRPVYLPGAVVTGRWASSGGGALQIPRQLRPAVRADDGWVLIMADVAQLEPRVLAAMAADSAMAQAAAGGDLYEGIVRTGIVATREEAKYAVLGAMYGATTGDSGRLVPRLRTVFTRAMRLVDDAARTGEEGGHVMTLLGRTSPTAQPPPAQDMPDAAYAARDQQRVRREFGRFTRNFIVQGTAAEWALVWLAEIRQRLWALPQTQVPAAASGSVANHRAHLVFFLHDEVIVHCPRELADAASTAVHEAAQAATRRLFGDFPITMPLDLTVSSDAHV
ncbi:bifunctional 3'-5' exonuclease/DNA polymerase [Microbacterium sp. YY-01]|uniref:bifunctional 3'-5' exonuclease/DNA polymerase n=1 Tax=Microbacterium sp. YY-01 TaxID=3421634 RepID=UPI003D17879E